MQDDGQDRVSQKDVLAILTEDVQSHRDYIQRLYRNAFYVGGVSLAAAVSLAYWMLGNQLDSSILQHRLDEGLKKKVEGIALDRMQDAADQISMFADREVEAASNQILTQAEEITEQAKEIVDQYAKTQLGQAVADLIKPQLEEISKAGFGELAGIATVPKGMTAFFDRQDGCPVGWLNMGSEWVGRTAVAASSDANAEYGYGRKGGAETHTLTIAEMPAHRHPIRSSEGGNANGRGVQYLLAGEGGNSASAYVGGNIPHNNMPPFIALYYCKKE